MRIVAIATTAFVAVVLLAGPAQRCRAQVDPGTAISAAALVKDLLTGINNALTDDARVDTGTQSGGPDDDDGGSRADPDVKDTPLETDLSARASGNLGANPDSPHWGAARMHVTRDLFDNNWTIVPGDRYAYAYPEKDSTPVAGADNTTAVGSVATFANHGTIQKGFTKTGDKEVALSPGQSDIGGRSSAALVWSPSEFTLTDVGDGQVSVAGPADRIHLGHNFLQMEGSTAFRDPFLTAPFGEGVLSDQVRGIAAGINADVDATLGTTPLGEGDHVDLTLTAADVVFRAGTFERGTKTDRELIEEYLSSGFVAFVAPDSVQQGYRSTLTLRQLLGGTHDFLPSSLLGQGGGFGRPGGPDDRPGFDLASMVGLTIETEGSLLAALQLAAQTPTSAFAAMLAGLNVGDSFTLTFSYNQSDAAYAARAVNAVPEPSGVLLLMGGGAVVCSIHRRRRARARIHVG